MRIGIDVSSALATERTGVEEYTYQLVKHISMLPEAGEHDLMFFAQKTKKRFWHERSLPALIESARADVFFSPSNPLPLRTPKSVRAIATIHGLEWKRTPASYSAHQRAYLTFRTRQTIKRADALIAVSERSRDGLYQFFGKRAISTPIEVVYHGIGASSRSHRGERGTQGKSFIFIGRKDKRKNIARIVEAFHLVRRAYKEPVHLTIAGRAGNDRVANTLRSDRFGDSTITVMPHVTPREKQRLMRENDVLLLPSLDEGFGMPIVEAHAHGMPSVTSAFLREIGGGGAIYCNPYNVESIADAMLRLLEHDQYYRLQKRAARENAKRFSWEKCAKETFAVLSEGLYGITRDS